MKEPKNCIIRIASISSKIGPLFIAANDKGVFMFSFQRLNEGVRILQRKYPGAKIRTNNFALQKNLRQIVSRLEQKRPPPTPKFDLAGTLFQKKVWRALTRIPFGKTKSYSEVAQSIGRARASRAVGTACAKNRIALLVPCHRVICSNGRLGNYAYGISLKKRLLDLEQATKK